MILLDTHAVAWAVLTPERLSATAADALHAAGSWQASAASLYEITLKAKLGEWPDVEGLLTVDLNATLLALGFEVIPATGPIMQRAGALDLAHRDPFDRIIVATAMHHGLPVVSKDHSLDSLGGAGWQRIW